MKMRWSPNMGTALAEALMKVLGGVVLLGALLGAIIVPMAIAGSFLGSNWGSSLGCAGAALLQLGLVGLLNRYPDLPGAPLVQVICGNLIAMMIVFAPIGAAIELIDDRATATWTGFAIGVGILALGYPAVRSFWSRQRSPLADPGRSAR